MTTIILSEDEMRLAALHGSERNIYNNRRVKTRPRYGAGNAQDWQLSIEGSLGELAFAKYLNVFPDNHLGDFSARDIAGYQVRTSKRRRLILHPNDGDNDIFVLICGYNGDYDIVGWILGKDGKNQSFWADPTGTNRPAFFVPANQLNSMASLPVTDELKQSKRGQLQQAQMFDKLVNAHVC